MNHNSTTKSLNTDALSATILDQLDAFEQLERALLADDRRDRAARLAARFALPGFGLSVHSSPPTAPALPE
jgi:hypothetical protein